MRLEDLHEFLKCLGQGRVAAADDPPFLGELAHQVWVELALTVDERGIDRDADLLSGAPVLSPPARPLACRFPVHRLAPDCRVSPAGRRTASRNRARAASRAGGSRA